MQNIRIEKVTINIGAGRDQGKLEKGMQLIKALTNKDAVQTVTQKRIPGWGLRPGLPIGCKLTLRKKEAEDILKRLLYAKDFKLEENNFDNAGNIAFGIPEYIDIEEAKYDPKIGVMGLEVCVTLEKPGYRVKKRRSKKSKIGKTHLIKKEESIKFMQEKFNVSIGEKE